MPVKFEKLTQVLNRNKYRFKLYFFGIYKIGNLKK